MFFKAIGKMKSDKRGFTITELMVTRDIALSRTDTLFRQRLRQ